MATMGLCRVYPDRLAALESKEAKKAGAESTTSMPWTQKARQIREDLALNLPALLEQAGNQWLDQESSCLFTIAEALFGFKRYQEASRWLTKAKSLKEVLRWERETTTRQLASLAKLQGEIDELPN